MKKEENPHEEAAGSSGLQQQLCPLHPLCHEFIQGWMQLGKTSDVEIMFHVSQ